jgi:hypothetical protein
MSAAGHRLERVAEEIRNELSLMLAGELKDPRLATSIDVTEVRVSPSGLPLSRDWPPPRDSSATNWWSGCSSVALPRFFSISMSRWNTGNTSRICCAK